MPQGIDSSSGCNADLVAHSWFSVGRYAIPKSVLWSRWHRNAALVLAPILLHSLVRVSLAHDGRPPMRPAKFMGMHQSAPVVTESAAWNQQHGGLSKLIWLFVLIISLCATASTQDNGRSLAARLEALVDGRVWASVALAALIIWSIWAIASATECSSGRDIKCRRSSRGHRTWSDGAPSTLEAREHSVTLDKSCRN
jgi:hypothetical protein